MTAADTAVVLALEKKYRQAEYTGNYIDMLDRTNEILSFSGQFPWDENIFSLQLHALLQRGEVYMNMGQQEQAESDFDVVIAESPFLPVRMKAYRLKMMAVSLPGKPQYARLDEYGEAVREIFGKIKKTEWYQTFGSEAADSLVIYGEAVHVWCVSLLEQERYDFARKIYLDYLAEYKNESDLENILDFAPFIYYGLARICRVKKDFAQEEFYLKRCLSLISEKNVAYAGMFLRSAAYAIRSGQYDQALKYCDTGLNWGTKQSYPTEKYKQGYHDMLWAGKMKIYQKMNLRKKAEECARRIKNKLPPDAEAGLNQLLFSF